MDKLNLRSGLRPLVVGAPRTGFSLLIHVVSQLLSRNAPVEDRRTRVLRAFIALAGDHVSREIIREAARLGVGNLLVFNPNFRALAGGPRWVFKENPNLACFRKYVGLVGYGDMCLVIRHPRQVLDCDDVLHTHSDPKFWISRAGEEGLAPLAALRNPVGTIYSSCFSINALTSEYLQRFVPPAEDNDSQRENLALYKLTDLRFFSGLIAPLKRYLEEFLEVRNQFRFVMRWEDLLTYPTRTIAQIAEALGVDLDEIEATEIWRRMAWRNLTGSHRHNFRRGHGIVGGWRRYLVNEHLALLRDSGLEYLSRELGYGPIGDLDPAGYSSYQTTVARMISRGEIHRDFPDPWLFEFAFNKSNLDASVFSYRQFDWRENTRIERSSMNRDDILQNVWLVAEKAAAQFNQAFMALLSLACDDESMPETRTRELVQEYAPVFGVPPAEFANKLAAAWSGPQPEPRLLQSRAGINIVQFGTRYYALPQSLGPIDLQQRDPSDLPGVLHAESFDAIVRSLDRTVTWED